MALVHVTSNYMYLPYGPQTNRGILFLAHMSRGLQVSLKYTHAPASVRRPSSTISKIFSSETAWPIKAKLHVEHPKEGGTKVYTNGPGHMTKMAAMAINSKNL